jgi:hypothetical protein
MDGMKTRYGLPVWLLGTAILLFTSMVPYTANAQLVQNVHRFFKSGKHLFTLDYSEGVNNGFAYEGVGFTTYIAPQASNSAPLYRCYKGSTNDHFASVDPNCEGATNEGSYGYLSTVPGFGLTPLMRFYYPAGRDHLQTKIFSEVGLNPNWSFEGVLGYVPM